MALSFSLSRRQLLQAGAAAALAAGLAGCGGAASSSASSVASSAPQPTPTPQPAAQQYRGIWISYLEWQHTDFSSAAAFTAAVGAMLDNCVALGLNTVVAQVRPFGDALYQSRLFPWSHLCTGRQGADPGFDPLDILVRECHARTLALEAWINPYRLRLHGKLPQSLCAENLANTHPDWVVKAGEGVYLNPALPQVAAYVVDGVREIVEHYAVDGIHFDDYFYPTTDAAVDEAQFAATGLSAGERDAWRRQNVTALVQQAYAAVKAADPMLRFGISPQGNPDNNYSQQYSDVAAWMNGSPCVDYICPQVYWGYGYTLSSGSTRFAFENIVPEWLAMPRAAEVALYFGLGAWRIGDGDGGKNEDSVTQWNTGENLCAMVADLNRYKADGYLLYRYDSLFESAYPQLAAAECDGIAQINREL